MSTSNPGYRGSAWAGPWRLVDSPDGRRWARAYRERTTFTGGLSGSMNGTATMTAQGMFFVTVGGGGATHGAVSVGGSGGSGGVSEMLRLRLGPVVA